MANYKLFILRKNITKIKKYLIFGGVIAFFFFAAFGASTLWKLLAQKEIDSYTARKYRQIERQLNRRVDQQINEIHSKQKELESKKAEVDQATDRLNKAIQEWKELHRLYNFILQENPKLNHGLRPNSFRRESMALAGALVQYCEEENLGGGPEKRFDRYHVYAIFYFESNFLCHKKGDSNKAVGPGQLWYSTWKLFAARFHFKPADYHKWPSNTRVCVAFAADLFRQYHDWETVYGNYNGGGDYRAKADAMQNIEFYRADYKKLAAYMERANGGMN